MTSSGRLRRSKRQWNPDHDVQESTTQFYFNKQRYLSVPYLRIFHDELMDAGRLPLSLIRWEMTGLDDEVQQFWQQEDMPKVN